MSSPWKTGIKNEALQALPEIVELAHLTLSHEKLAEANLIAHMLAGSKKQRRYAIRKLISLVPDKPTRPLLYLLPLIMQLPRLTRDNIRYVGDYIDLLTKEMTFEFVGGNARKNSLGSNVKALEKVIVVPNDLTEQLRRFNNFLYTPGKHDFSLPPGRSHRFTSREAVFAIYVSVELGERIKSLSRLVRVAVQKDNLYMIGGRWGSSNRVVYAGEQ